MPFVQAAELEWSEVDIPDTVVDLLQSDVFAGADARNVDPIATPANAAVGADIGSRPEVGWLRP